jgi:hypothetical protein
MLCGFPKISDDRMISPRITPDPLYKRKNSTGIITSVLQSQAFIADYDQSEYNAGQMAYGCYMAMEEMMRTICKFYGVDRHDDCDLFDFICMVTEYPIVDKSNKPEQLAVDTISFPIKARSSDNIRFLRAIISLTRFAYEEKMRSMRDGKSTWPVPRIIGHCARNEIQSYINLLDAWIKPQDKMSLTYVYEEHSPDREAQLAFDSLPNALVVGLPFSSTSRIFPPEPSVHWTMNGPEPDAQANKEKM